MRKLLLFILAVASLNMYATDYSFTIGSKQYKLVKTQKTWADAAAWAVQDGGYLVEIGSLAEQNGIWSAIQSSGVSTTYTSVSDGGGIAYIWIGATDKNTEGTWIWDGDNDGQGVNFYTGQGNWGAGNGAAVNGAYINWGGTNTGSGSNEPDDYGSSQDAAAIGMEAWPAPGTGNIAGEWNDIDKSNTLYFIVEYDATGINEGDNSQNTPDFTILQNENGQINILSDNAIQEVEIYNMEGKRVYMANNLNVVSYKLDSKLSSGIYFIRSRFEQGLRSKKVYIR